MYSVYCYTLLSNKKDVIGLMIIIAACWTLSVSCKTFNNMIKAANETEFKFGMIVIYWRMGCTILKNVETFKMPCTTRMHGKYLMEVVISRSIRRSVWLRFLNDIWDVMSVLIDEQHCTNRQSHSMGALKTCLWNICSNFWPYPININRVLPAEHTKCLHL